MSRPYGRRPRQGNAPSAAPPAGEVQVNITGRHTIEQLALEVQRAIAMVQDYGATGVEKFRFRLMPLDDEGAPTVLHDGAGQPVSVINIPEEPAAPAYRPNEPGVGVEPRTNPAIPTREATSSYPEERPMITRSR